MSSEPSASPREPAAEPGTAVPRLVRPRERLFALLDEGRARGSVWVAGRAGAGKSALIDSWLDVRGLHGVRHRLEPEDADPFGLLANLAERARLPAEDVARALALPDPFVAARQVFALAYRAVGVIVFDEHERLPPESTVQRILADAMAALPAGATLIVIGRHPPPAAFARARANASLALVDGAALALDDDEIDAVARAHAGRRLHPDELERIASQADGWAAMVVLLAGTSRTGDVPAGPPEGAGVALPEVLFDYLAEEVVGRLGVGPGHDLEALSLLPGIDVPVAAALTGEPGIGARLATLADRHFFLDRWVSAAAPASTERYHMHDLLRRFLRARLRQRIGDAAVGATSRRAAGLLRAAGRGEGAVRLLLECEAFDEAALAIAELAPGLLGRMRSGTLLDWLDALPVERVRGDAILSLWAGAASSLVDPVVARVHLERAWPALARAPGELGAICCTAAITTWIARWDDFHGMDPWVARLETWRAERTGPPSPAIEARVTAAMTNAVLCRRGGAGERAAHWGARALAGLDERLDPQVFPMMAQGAALVAIWTDGMSAAELAVDRIRRTLFADARADAIGEHWYRAIEAMLCWNLGDGAGALRACERGMACGHEAGTDAMAVLLQYHACIGCLLADDVPRARELHAAVAAAARSDQLMNVVCHHHLAALLAREDGTPELGVRHLEQAIERAESAGLHFALAYERVGLAWLLVETGDADRAQACVDLALSEARALHLTLVELECRLCAAWLAHRAGRREAALGALAEGLRIAARDGRVASAWWRADALGELCGLAIEAGIEPGHAARIVTVNRVPAAPAFAHLSGWPWRVRVRVLGTGSIEVDGSAIDIGRGRVSKPVELVQLLAAHGGRIGAARASDLLWPEADGDAAAHSLKTTLARARRLLGLAAAMRLEEGELRLDAALCWSDAGALELIDRRAIAAPEPGADDAALVALYAGHLLAHADAAWVAAPRRRLRERWVRAVLHRGELLDREIDARAACRWYAAALEVAPALEAVHRRGIEALLRAERPDAVAEAWARCVAECAGGTSGALSDPTLALGRRLGVVS